MQPDVPRAVIGARSLPDTSLWVRTLRWMLLAFPCSVLAGSAIAVLMSATFFGHDVAFAPVMIVFGLAIGFAIYVATLPVLWAVLITFGSLMPAAGSPSSGRAGLVIVAASLVSGAMATMTLQLFFNGEHPWPPEGLSLMLGPPVALGVAIAGRITHSDRPFHAVYSRWTFAACGVLCVAALAFLVLR